MATSHRPRAASRWRAKYDKLYAKKDKADSKVGFGPQLPDLQTGAGTPRGAGTPPVPRRERGRAVFDLDEGPLAIPLMDYGGGSYERGGMGGADANPSTLYSGASTSFSM